MTTSKIAAALGSVDWALNVNDFIGDAKINQDMERASQRLAVWSRQLERIDQGNPALSFVREMQASCHLVAVCTSLGIYKGAASGMRTMVETALYYTYFRVHLVELPTLLRNEKWYISKSDVLDFHILHSENFTLFQSRLGLIAELNKWYSEISAIIHGQIPGRWLQPKNINGFSGSAEGRLAASEMFCKGEEIIHKLFLATVGKENWESVSTTAKSALLKNLPGDIRMTLGLDLA